MAAVVAGLVCLRLVGIAIGGKPRGHDEPERRAQTSAATAAPSPAVRVDTSSVEKECAAKGPGYEVFESVGADGSTTPTCRKKAAVGEDGEVSKGSWEAANGAGTWPLALEHGHLRCFAQGPLQAVMFDADDGRRFGVNGAARSCVENPQSAVFFCRGKRVLDVDTIWLEDPHPPPGVKKGEFRINIGSLIPAGQALCAR